ncbi:MAG: hypothetical protein KBT46_03555 [Ruminococcus sp.]|nr:hypothetical protein [Candidatus Copronaster equi]
MSRKPKLTPEQEISLCYDYINGIPPLQLTLKYGLSTNGIWYLLRRHNVSTGKYKKRSVTNV